MTSFALDATRARGYLLRQIADDDAAVIEEAYLSDDRAVEQIAAAEDVLIEDYLHGQLTAAERVQFERTYLASPQHRARVETIRRLVARATASAEVAGADRTPRTTATAVTAATSWRASWWTPWMALAASVVAVAAATWLWALRVTPTSDLASTSPATALGTSSTAPATSSTAPGAAAPPVATPAPHLFALVLSPVAVRSASDAVVAVIPAGTDVVTLRLAQDAEARQLIASQMSIRTVTGAEMWRGPASDGRSTSPGVVASAEVPVSALPADDYLVTLFGRDTSGVEQEWMQYSLRVRYP